MISMVTTRNEVFNFSLCIESVIEKEKNSETEKKITMTKRATVNSFTIADGISDDKKPRVKDLNVVDNHDRLQPLQSCVSPSGSIFEGDCNVLSLRNNVIYTGGIRDSKCSIFYGLQIYPSQTTTRHSINIVHIMYY